MRIYVRYWEPDKQKALAAVRAIKDAGIEADCGPSQSASRADCVLLLWSAAASESADVQETLSFALKAWSQGLLVLAVLDDAPLPLGLRDLPKSDLRDFTENNVDNMVRAVLAALHEKPHGEITAAPPPVALPSSRSWRGIGIAGILLVAALVIGFGSLMSFRSSVPTPQETAAPPPPEPQIEAPDPSVHHRHEREEHRPEPETLPDKASVSSGTATTLMIVAVPSLVLLLLAALLARRRWGHEATSDDMHEQHAGGSSAPTPVVQPGALAQVFVSYSSLDIGSVEPIILLIEKTGQHIWIDRNSSGSARYAAKISYAMRNARVVALMCSKSAFQSDHVIRELYLAADFKKPFIVFMLDATDIPDEAEYFLSGFPRIPIAGLSAMQLSSRIEQALQT